MSTFGDYIHSLKNNLTLTEVTDTHGNRIHIEIGFAAVKGIIKNSHQNGNKIIFVGNGGSAAIASHMAIDYQKNGNFRCLAFNDGAALTCLSNDLGYSFVFSHQISKHGSAGDTLFIISSSGNSPSVIHARAAGEAQGMNIITLSGFTPNNQLRSRGMYHFYVPSMEYGFVEIAHLTILHAILDTMNE